jgi:hypothetical protein
VSGPKKRHQTQTERDIEGAAAKRDRERDRDVIPQHVDGDETPIPALELPLDLPQPVVTVIKDIRERVWALRHEPDRLDHVEDIVNALSRESARTAAIVETFLLPNAKSITGTAHAAFESSQSNSKDITNHDRRFADLDKHLAHLAQMVATIDRETATTAVAFRKDGEHRDDRDRRHEEEIDELTSKVSELTNSLAASNAARDKAVKELEERLKPFEASERQKQTRATALVAGGGAGGAGVIALIEWIARHI